VRRFYLLLDHNNLPPGLVREHQIPRIIDQWLGARGFLDDRVETINVRAYGGWFVGASISAEREAATTEYNSFFDTAFRLRGGLVRVRFEFADSLAAGRKAHITHTVAERKKKPRVVFGDTVCNEAGCELEQIKRWSKARERACGLKDCHSTFGHHARRREQKQVDVHIAVDLMLLVLSEPDLVVAVASDDVDIVPGVLAASAISGADLTIVRFIRNATYADETLLDRGVYICQLQSEVSA